MGLVEEKLERLVIDGLSWQQGKHKITVPLAERTLGYWKGRKGPIVEAFLLE